jgi:hypothetical protein
VNTMCLFDCLSWKGLVEALSQDIVVKRYPHGV